MKLDFDINKEQFAIVQNVLEQHLPVDCKVWIFGSRAKNTAQDYSDLDLALEGKEKIDKAIISQLKEAFEGSLLPYTVDILDLNDISNEFKTIIDQQKILFSIEENKAISKLRFKNENGNDYPDWQEKKLGEVFHSKKGSGLSKKNIVSDGKYKCILYGTLFTKYDEIIDEVIDSTNEEGKVKSQIGDLLVPTSTTTTGIDLANFTALNKEGVLLSGDITILKFNKKGDNVYWAYYLTHYKKYELARYAQGTTIVHIYFSHFKKTQIEEPSLPEQKKIANFLCSVDEKIEKLTRKKELLQEYKKGIMQKIFSQELRFKDENNNHYPDWDEKKLGGGVV